MAKNNKFSDRKKVLIAANMEYTRKSSDDHPDKYNQREISAFRKELENAGFDVDFFNFSKGRIEDRLADLKNTKKDIVFNLIDCVVDKGDTESYVIGAMELLEIPHTGSSAWTVRTCSDKEKMKQFLAVNDIPTAKHIVVSPENEKTALKNMNLKYPLFVKPVFGDGSVGIDLQSLVKNENELNKKIRDVINCRGNKALVEEYLNGKELTVVIIGNKNPEVAVILEIFFNNEKFQTFSNKWTFAETKSTSMGRPKELPKQTADEIKSIALRCYKIFGCRDYARIDFRLDSKGRPKVIDVNANPGMTIEFELAAKHNDLRFSDILGKIINEALKRNEQEKAGKKC